jgi:Flp pilus assembly protein TadG
VHHQLRKLQDESGQAMTEFALVLPLLFVLIFAIIEGGLTVNRYLQLTDAVRVGARVASVNGSQGPAVAAPAATSALTGAVDGLTLTNVSVTASCPTTPTPTTCTNSWQSGNPVTVQASVQYTVKLPLFGTVASGYLTSKSIQRIE